MHKIDYFLLTILLNKDRFPMSFAVFDPLFVLLSEEIDVPLPKLKKAWESCLVKYFKTDPTLLAKVTPKLQQAKKPEHIPVEEPKLAEEPVVKEKSKRAAPKTEKKEVDPKVLSKEEKKPVAKLPVCDWSGCTIGVKLARPIDGKNYCSKHFKRASTSKSSVSTTKTQPDKTEESEEESESEEEIKEPELKEESEEEESELEDDPDEEEDPETILRKLKLGFDDYCKQIVTPQNYTKVGSIEQYLVFFRNNWHDFQKVYEDLVCADDLQMMIQKKKIQKADLYMLFSKTNSKLVVS
jgi:hypothetical protein